MEIRLSFSSASRRLRCSSSAFAFSAALMLSGIKRSTTNRAATNRIKNTYLEINPPSQKPAAVAITSASNANSSRPMPRCIQRAVLFADMYSFIRQKNKTMFTALWVIAQGSQVS